MLRSFANVTHARLVSPLGLTLHARLDLSELLFKKKNTKKKLKSRGGEKKKPIASFA